MRRQSQCPKCAKKTIHRTGSCVACGTPVKVLDRLLSARSARRWGAGIAVALTMITLFAITYADRYLPAVADWYLEMAVPYAASGWSEFTPTDPDEHAFYACARSLVKHLDQEGTIATFPNPRENPARSLGEGRYRIESYVQATAETGRAQVREFSCTVRYDGTRWAIEDIQLKPFVLARVGL